MCYNVLMETIQHLETYQLILFIALGLAVLFFGYRIKKVAFFIIWFILGFNLVMWLMSTINELVPEVAKNSLYQNLLPIAGGLLIALLGFSVEKLCVGGICFVVVMLSIIQYFGTDLQTVAIGGVVGVIAAGAAVMLMKPAIIIATAVAGSYALTLAIFAIAASNLNFEAYYWPILIGLAAVGATFQFVTTKRID